MYFAITTMATIGYGDLKPSNSYEYIVVSFLEVIAGIVFAYNVGKIGNLFSNYNQLADSYR